MDFYKDVELRVLTPPTSRRYIARGILAVYLHDNAIIAAYQAAQIHTITGLLVEFIPPRVSRNAHWLKPHVVKRSRRRRPIYRTGKGIAPFSFLN
jgi:hypothetical protein